MESDDDYQNFSQNEEPSSPIHQRNLKRLKKAVRVSNELTAPPFELSPSKGFFDSPNDADHESLNTLDLGKHVELVRSVLGSEGFVDETDSGTELDGLLADQDSSEARRTLNVEEEAHFGALDAATEEFDAKVDHLNNDLGEEVGGLNTENSTKNILSSKETGEDKKKNKKKRRKNAGDDGKTEALAFTKRRLEKERKAQLEQLHAESQRLLRETRDVAFKPVPLVQKPISSVLERIRQRKREVSKKAGILNSYSEIKDSSGDITPDPHPEHTRGDEEREVKHAEEESDTRPVNLKSSHLDPAYVDSCRDSASLSDQHENILSKITKTAFRNPINDTQDLLYGSQESDGEDVQPDCQANISREEVLAPSLLTMNLKFDSAPPDDVSSNEEDDDKENIDPHPIKLVKGDSYLKGDPVKAFVDDEAEEDDDSDNDLVRFPENEEDNENEDTEEFDDLIVTGYKEKPIDNEKRDELHQKWLEQQDAAATDNVLQRLKSGWKQREPTMLEEEGEDEEFAEDSMDEASDDLLPTIVAQINSKKVKQMIPQMFTDKDDTFLSSDDEETEQRLVRQRILEKAEGLASFVSPAEDESSREVFGLIKKLNVAPSTKKKEKSSLLDMLITGGNSNSSSKPSFLGRMPSNSLPSSHKQSSSNFRSFIFGRDDSNSRSGISTSEVSLDRGEKEDRPRSVSAKFSSSQSKCNSQNRITTETSSGSCLLKILRRSMQSDQSTRNNTVGQTQAVVQFAAFKSGKKSIKIEART